jgi:hypothetical protein
MSTHWHREQRRDLNETASTSIDRASARMLMEAKKSSGHTKLNPICWLRDAAMRWAGGPKQTRLAGQAGDTTESTRDAGTETRRAKNTTWQQSKKIPEW